MKANGLDPQLSHYRRQDRNTYAQTYNNSKYKNVYGKKPTYLATGGATICSLKGVNGTFDALCSNEDNFCFKTGAYLAVSRAYDYYVKSGIAKPKKKSCTGSCCGKCDKEKTASVYVVAGYTKTGTALGYLKKGTNERLNRELDDDDCSVYEYTTDKEYVYFFKTKEEAQKFVWMKDEKIIKITHEIVS